MYNVAYFSTKRLPTRILAALKMGTHDRYDKNFTLNSFYSLKFSSSSFITTICFRTILSTLKLSSLWAWNVNKYFISCTIDTCHLIGY